jgi:hypothetical protein
MMIEAATLENVEADTQIVDMHKLNPQRWNDE